MEILVEIKRVDSKSTQPNPTQLNPSERVPTEIAVQRSSGIDLNKVIKNPLLRSKIKLIRRDWMRFSEAS
jgi:hypothetical protein